LADQRKTYWYYIKIFFTSKYVITAIVFIIYLAFFQQYNWLEQLSYKKERKALEQKKDFYQNEIKKIEGQTNSLENDNEAWKNMQGNNI